jgi:gamma-glutamyltranspeptidase / glutathione hydrolase
MEVERGKLCPDRVAVAALGHKVTVPDTPLGGAQAIRIEGDVLVGASDPRKDGCALGY